MALRSAPFSARLAASLSALFLKRSAPTGQALLAGGHSRRTAPALAVLPSVALVVLLSLALGACAPLRVPAGPPITDALLRDNLFPGTTAPVDVDSIFAVSPAMQRYLDTELAGAETDHQRRSRLLAALRREGRLLLDYDDGTTRNAAEAFDRRAGNCLSLVVLTAALARHLGLPVRYQMVHVRPQFSRTDSLTFSSGHVNLVLTLLPPARRLTVPEPDELTVDFVPGEELHGVRVEPLREQTLVAMFMNNRAAEQLADRQPAAAYAWARAAVRQDPSFLAAANTLAIVYLRSGHLEAAESALRHVLARAPDDVVALSNLVVTLQRANRTGEAQVLAARLRELQPFPPFHFLDLGVQALQSGEPARARELIARELRRQPYQHEAHFWAGVADAALGDTRGAEQHLRQAIALSGSPTQGARYSAKLAALTGGATP